MLDTALTAHIDESIIGHICLLFQTMSTVVSMRSDVDTGGVAGVCC